MSYKTISTNQTNRTAVLECQMCGKHFEVTEAQLVAGINLEFCSLICQEEYIYAEQDSPYHNCRWN